jgi:hypothetical protein
MESASIAGCIAAARAELAALTQERDQAVTERQQAYRVNQEQFCKMQMLEKERDDLKRQLEPMDCGHRRCDLEALPCNCGADRSGPSAEAHHIWCKSQVCCRQCRREWMKAAELKLLAEAGTFERAAKLAELFRNDEGAPHSVTATRFNALIAQLLENSKRAIERATLEKP